MVWCLVKFRGRGGAAALRALASKVLDVRGRGFDARVYVRRVSAPLKEVTLFLLNFELPEWWVERGWPPVEVLLKFAGTPDLSGWSEVRFEGGEAHYLGSRVRLFRAASGW